MRSLSPNTQSSIHLLPLQVSIRFPFHLVCFSDKSHETLFFWSTAAAFLDHSGPSTINRKGNLSVAESPNIEFVGDLCVGPRRLHQSSLGHRLHYTLSNPECPAHHPNSSPCQKTSLPFQTHLPTSLLTLVPIALGPQTKTATLSRPL